MWSGSVSALVDVINCGGFLCCWCVWFLHWRFWSRIRVSTMVTCTPVPHEEYSSRTGSGDYTGNICNDPFLHLSVVFTVMILFLFPLLSCLFSCTGKEEEQDSPELSRPQFLHFSFHDWHAGKIQLFKPTQASVLQPCALRMEPHTHTHPLLQEKNPGACARFQVLEEMILLETTALLSCCFSSFPASPVISGGEQA